MILVILVAAIVVMLGGGIHLLAMDSVKYSPKLKGLCNYKLKNHIFRCNRPRGHEGGHVFMIDDCRLDFNELEE